MKGNLVAALTDVPQTLNPYESNNLHIHTVMWPIYEPLLDIAGFDSNHNIQFRPCLARSVAPGPKPLTYDFLLSEGVTFSNGDTFDVSSVVDNLDRVRKQPPTSFREQILHDLIDGVQPAGPQTLRVTLKYPKPELLFLALMTNPKDPRVGTGPFRLESRSDSEIVLQRNPHYRVPVQLQNITFKIFANPDDVVAAFNGQQLDFIRDIDPDRLRQLRGPSVLRVVPYGLHYLGFNWGSAALKTPAVRQAVRDMIDFKQIASKTGLRPAKGPVPPSVEAYDSSSLPAPQQSRAQARSTIENACRGPITLFYNANSYYGNELAKSIQSDLGNLVISQPQGSSSQLLRVLNDRRKANSSDNYIFIYNWYSILPAAEIFLRPLFETGMPDNLTGYSQPQVDGSLKDVRDGKITPLAGYTDAQTKIIDDLPAIFLGHSQVRYSASSAGVSGLTDLNVQSFPVDRYAGVDVI
jgi:peptide/nickel transport system substrate-binding protein